MRFLLTLLLLMTVLFAAKESVKLDERYKDSTNCKACHNHIVSQWSVSWHAKSHVLHDEYFRKSVEYVSRKTRKSINSIKVQCAACHNPRISVTKTDEEYEIAAAMGLSEGSDVDEAVADEGISEGINCVVCHNINKIHDEYDATKRGVHRVEWTPSGTMTGPFKDAKSPYHKTVYHDFMDKTPNKLCFVCHANDRSVNGLVFTNMEKEYKGNQKCVSCHMGPKEEGVAATYRMNGKVKKRKIRNHSFRGAHVEEMWNGALHLSLSQKRGKVYIKISNPQPHNLPSGFGGRDLVIDLIYKDAKGKVIKRKEISLGTHYKRKRGKPSIPHVARKQTKDMSIPAKGSRVIKVEKIAGAKTLEVVLTYRLVTKEIDGILELEDPIWCSKFYIDKKVLNF